MKTITVLRQFPGSSPNDAVYQDALSIGSGLARAGYTVMSGGYFGVMEAVSKGARQWPAGTSSA